NVRLVGCGFGARGGILDETSVGRRPVAAGGRPVGVDRRRPSTRVAVASPVTAAGLRAASDRNGDQEDRNLLDSFHRYPQMRRGEYENEGDSAMWVFAHIGA